MVLDWISLSSLVPFLSMVALRGLSSKYSQVTCRLFPVSHLPIPCTCSAQRALLSIAVGAVNINELMNINDVCKSTTIFPRPYKLTFCRESGVRVTRDVGYLCPNFGLPRPLCSRVILDVHDRQTSDSIIA